MSLMRFFKNKAGATAVEYGVIIALIGVSIISAVGLAGSGLNSTFHSSSMQLNAAD